MSRSRRAQRRGEAGFTLMEVIVASVLLAVLIGMATPYVGGVLGIELKSAARQLAGTMRFVFDEAAINSSNYRLVINLDRHSYTVEQCPGASSAILYRNADERVRGEEALAERLRRLEESAASGSSAAMVPLSDAALQSCSPASDPQLAPVTLEEPLTILGVWTAQYPAVMRGNPNGPPEDPAEDQVVVINFLKGGYAERAYLYLSDGGEDIYTLELEPLTGQVILHDGEYEVPREFWRQQ